MSDLMRVLETFSAATHCEAAVWVRAEGAASVEEQVPERDRAFELLREKYHQYREGVEPLGAAVVVRVSRWSGWAYE